MTISERIFALLKTKHLSQKELSEYTGLSPAAISSWKANGTNPSSDKIIKICEFLEVEPYYLLTGENEPPAPLIVADASPGYRNPYEPDEADMLTMFRKLRPVDQGRILEKMEQILSQYHSEQ